MSPIILDTNVALYVAGMLTGIGVAILMFLTPDAVASVRHIVRHVRERLTSTPHA